ncbi:MAG: WYL domain-containing transcriptional regulator [bacterium]
MFRPLDTARQLRSRPPLSRMMVIHDLLQNGRHPNRNQLAKRMETSVKTVQRDIDFMRDRLGLPIEYDEKEHGYYYTQSVHHFPNMQVTEGEIVALFMAQKALALYHGTPFEGPLKAAFEKLANGLKDTVSFSIADLESAFSFSMKGLDVTDVNLFELLSRATLRCKEVEFEYCRLESDRYQLRHAQPYHLACVEKQWYLFSFDLDRQDMRTFALTRMKNARMTEKKFVRSPDFSLTKYLGDSFGVRTSSGSYKIRIRFDGLAAKLVRERPWHASQKIKELKRGEIELSMTLGSLTEVKRWILSWGQHARVLSPNELIARLKKDAAVLSRYYL